MKIMYFFNNRIFTATLIMLLFFPITCISSDFWKFDKIDKAMLIGIPAANLTILAGWSILAKKLYNNSFTYEDPQTKFLLQVLSFVAASPSISLALTGGLALYNGNKSDFFNTFGPFVFSPFRYLVWEPVAKASLYLEKKLRKTE